MNTSTKVSLPKNINSTVFGHSDDEEGESRRKAGRSKLLSRWLSGEIDQVTYNNLLTQLEAARV
jgi:hypothetical protein